MKKITLLRKEGMSDYEYAMNISKIAPNEIDWEKLDNHNEYMVGKLIECINLLKKCLEEKK